MDIEVRAIRDDEVAAYWATLSRAFGELFRPEDIEEEAKIFELDRTIAAFEGDALVGCAGIYSLPLSIPGGTLPMAGVTQVGVLPTHRRRGVLTELMRKQLEDVRDRGELVAGLWASESSIYGRFGYGMAAQVAGLEIERSRSAFIRPHQPGGLISLIEKEEALKEFPPIYQRVVAGWPGMWGRNEAWWRHSYADLEHWRDGASPLYFAVHRTSAGSDGFVTYRLKQQWQEFPGGTVLVRELIAETPEAYADLWRYCFDIDLRTKIEAWPRPTDEPLAHLLAEPRRLITKVHDSLWLRLVDLPGALSARRYSAPGRVVFEVRDGFCPWNDGRHELTVDSDGTGRCVPTDAPPDLVLSAADLGATYLGGASFGALAWVGRVQGEETVLRRADAMFAWDPKPWCPQVF
jgi:predicted acetyltransferase